MSTETCLKTHLHSALHITDVQYPSAIYSYVYYTINMFTTMQKVLFISNEDVCL